MGNIESQSVMRGQNFSTLPSNNQLNSLEGLSLLESLPDEILANIIAQLPVVTGSVGVLNEKDISVIAQYMHNFSLASKRTYSFATDPYIIKLFFEALGEKYNDTPENLAAGIDTIASRRFLWSYTEEREFDKIYDAIQIIYTLASTTLGEGQKWTVEEDGKPPSPNAFYFRTQNGFFIYCDRFIRHVATPFGKVELFQKKYMFDEFHLKIHTAFLKKLNASLKKIARIPYGENGQIEDIFCGNDGFPMDIEQMDTEKAGSGEENRLHRGYSVYKIHEMDGKPLPELKQQDERECKRSSKLMEVIWKMLQRNHQGKDPVLPDNDSMDIASDPNPREKAENIKRSGSMG